MTFQEFTTKYNVVLNPQQLKAVTTTGVPLLVLSVPGSGKTTVVAAHIAYLIHCLGVDPNHILALTFNRSASEELRNRICEKYTIPYLPRSIGQTIHSFGRDICMAYDGPDLTIEKYPEITIGRVWKSLQNEYPDSAKKQMVASCIAAYKNNMWTEDEMAANEDYADVWPVCKGVLNALEQDGKMLMDDYLVGAYKILTTNSEALKQLQDCFTYICVDEAQDNSKIQNAILDLIGERVKDLFYVGDDDQCIYRFRCAYPESLRDFTIRKKDAGAQRMVMPINYRSTPEIVTAGSNLIAYNPDYYNKNMRAFACSGGAVEYCTIPTHKDQYYWLANYIQNAQTSGKTIGVLFRDNDSAIPLLDALSLLGIRCRINRTYTPQQKSKEMPSVMTSGMAKGLHALIDFLCDPYADTNGYRFKSFYPYLGLAIKGTTAEKVGKLVFARNHHGEKTCALDVYLRQYGMSDHNLDILDNLIDLRDAVFKISAIEVINKIFDNFGYGNKILDTESTTLIRDVFLSIARSIPTIRELNNRLNKLNDLYARAQQNDRANVILSTVHSAKGLEYDTVILMDMMDGAFPKNLDDADSVIEDRNLAYVAVTRAKSKLVVLEYGDCSSIYVSEMKNPPAKIKRMA